MELKKLNLFLAAMRHFVRTKNILRDRNILILEILICGSLIRLPNEHFHAYCINIYGNSHQSEKGYQMIFGKFLL